MKRRIGSSLRSAILRSVRHLIIVGRVRLVHALCSLLGRLGRSPANFPMRTLQTIAWLYGMCGGWPGAGLRVSVHMLRGMQGVELALLGILGLLT